MNKKQNSTYENPIEMYFRWYLEELKQEGYLKDFEREAETLIVLNAFEYNREKHFKTKENVREPFNLTPAITYTYDYRLVWDKKALNIFTEPMHEGGCFRFGVPPFISHYIELMDEQEIVSYVDVKPHASAAQFGGGKLSSFYTFPFIQKFLLEKYHIYVNKIIPINQGKHGVNTNLFATTFTPRRYNLTDKGQMQRKIPFKKTTLHTFVERRKSIVEDLLRDIEKKNAKNNQQTLL